ncbi:hypothetical protein DZC73_27785 [Albitalea terrae]|uniref:Tyr recombinase domain-containing protein n=2 Tax=Piscinibacter terrae TaxID=2496871 RepID=A0A3N7JQH9_9BURK|nr:hypothetical protein DZC73_27785 [Albitalea terrae]
MEVCNAYVSHLKSLKKISAGEVENTFSRYIRPSSVASVEACEATADQFSEILREIIKAGHGVTAAKLRAELHAAYAQAIKAKLNPSVVAFPVDPRIRTNPIKEIASLSAYNAPGERFLDKAELAEFWRLLVDKQQEHLRSAKRFVRLTLLLGGQRAQQLLRVQIKDVDLAQGLIRLLDPKGARVRPREHLLPAGPTAMTELASLVSHARDIGSPMLFPGSQGGEHLSDGTISNEVRTLSAELMRAGRIHRPFKYADLRRTIETTLASLGVSKDVRAQIQSHGLSGIQTRHYDRYDYINEKRNALLLWEHFLESLLN